jgi:hypothetical protein
MLLVVPVAFAGVSPIRKYQRLMGASATGRPVALSRVPEKMKAVSGIPDVGLTVRDRV